mmetsp:Transcript_2564/g.3392  ORF Transcript_2564/g.3392 Transcript_2564/m.3392 type:complete len:151 (-) Transcript_2564:22-474(-)
MIIEKNHSIHDKLIRELQLKCEQQNRQIISLIKQVESVQGENKDLRAELQKKNEAIEYFNGNSATELKVNTQKTYGFPMQRLYDHAYAKPETPKKSFLPIWYDVDDLLSEDENEIDNEKVLVTRKDLSPVASESENQVVEKIIHFNQESR